MDEQQYSPDKPELEPLPEPELSFTDKVIGVISEPPTQFFAKYRLVPKKTGDWLIPIMLYLLLFAITQGVHFSDPEIVQGVKDKARKASIEQLDKQGLTEAEKQKKIEELEMQLGFIGTPVYHVITGVSVFIMGLVSFFIVAGILYMFVRLVYQDNLVFRDVLVAHSAINYIGIIQLLIALGLSLAMSRVIMETSIGSILNIDKTTLNGYLLFLLDPISLWILWVKGVALEQFTGSPKYRYRLTIFGLWAVFMGVLYALKDSLPMGSF